MAEPAAATAHNTGARSALTGPPSQQGPATSNHGRAAHALSSLATVSTGNGEGMGGSVEMSALPSQQAAQHATSAPAAFAPPAAVLPAPPLADAVGEAALAAHAAAAAAAAQAAAHAAASAPATVPPQAFVAPPAGAAAQPAAPAASVSMSGQGDTPGGQVFGTGVVAMPQSSAAAAQQAAGGALQEGQGDMAPPAEARSRQQGGLAALSRLFVVPLCLPCWRPRQHSSITTGVAALLPSNVVPPVRPLCRRPARRPSTRACDD